MRQQEPGAGEVFGRGRIIECQRIFPQLFEQIAILGSSGCGHVLLQLGQIGQRLLMQAPGSLDAGQTPVGDEGLGRIVVQLVPGQAFLLALAGLFQAAQFEQGPALIVVKGGEPAAHLGIGTAFRQLHRQLVPAALLLQRGGDGHHVRCIDGEIKLLVPEPLLPGLFKQCPGTGLVAGGVEGATALQQGAQARAGGGIGEAGLYLVEQLVRLGKLALQGVGAG